MKEQLSQWVYHLSGQVARWDRRALVLTLGAVIGLVILSIWVMNQATDQLEPWEETAVEFAEAAMIDHDRAKVESLLTSDTLLNPEEMNQSVPLQGGTVYVASQSDGPDKRKVYFYLDPTMTEGGLLKVLSLRLEDGQWKVDKARSENVGRRPFDQFEDSLEYQKLGIDDWKEVTLE